MKISQAFLIVNISEFSISVELTILSMLLLLPISEELLAVCTCKPLLCAMCSQSCKFCFRCCFQSSFGSSCTNCISPQQGELQDGWKSVDSCLFPMLQTQWFAEPSTVELSLTAFHSPATKEQEGTQDCGNQGFSWLPYIYIYICPCTLCCLYLKYPGILTEQHHTLPAGNVLQ